MTRRGYEQEAVLRDGQSISIRHRFFVAKRELVASDLAWLGRLDDGCSEVALAAAVHEAGVERVLGIARYTRVSAEAAEIAFDVADAHQGRGIGTLLLEHLARIARSHQFTKFRADVEADNAQMLEVFEQSGFGVCEQLEQGIYRVELPIAETDEFLRIASTREREARQQLGHARCTP